MNAISLQILIAFLMIGNFSLGQHSSETTIRQLDNEERMAILNKDTAKLYQLMSLYIVVQNPENTIVGFREIIDRIRTGKISYIMFQRVIEKLTIFNNTAVVMGKEILIPDGSHRKIITRRFTNIWMKEKKVWKLTARQATLVLPD